MKISLDRSPLVSTITLPLDLAGDRFPATGTNDYPRGHEIACTRVDDTAPVPRPALPDHGSSFDKWRKTGNSVEGRVPIMRGK